MSKTPIESEELCKRLRRATRAGGCVPCDRCIDDMRLAADQIDTLRAQLLASEAKRKDLVEECKAWRAWNDRDPFNPDEGILAIESARAAVDASRAMEGEGA